MGRHYIRPDVIAPPVRATQESNELTADTLVVVIFRGGPPIRDMYDSKDYTVPPVPEGVDPAAWLASMQPASDWTLPYEVAVHLQNRAIVPGTRDPHVYRKAISQIGIPNVDRADRCTPFTDEELEKFGNLEGIDRSQFMDMRRKVKFVDTRDALANAVLDVDDVLDTPPDAEDIAPPSDHEGLAEVRAAEAAARSEGIQGSKTRRGRTTFNDEK